MVSCTTRVITEDKNFVRVDQFKSEHFYYNLTFICWIYHPTVMYRKKALEEVNMYTAAFSEDFEIFWQISRKYQIYNLPEILLDYRVTNQSLHQVLKKKEYEIAQQEQVLRNIRHYTDEHYYIPDSYLECYRHNFEPILARNDVNTMIACIKELDYITQCILAKPNANHNATAIKKAAMHKRNFIVWFFAQKLPLAQKLYFLVQVYSLIDGLKSLRAFIREQFALNKPKAAFTFSR